MKEKAISFLFIIRDINYLIFSSVYYYFSLIKQNNKMKTFLHAYLIT